jgi:hypothetical protein
VYMIYIRLEPYKGVNESFTWFADRSPLGIRKVETHQSDQRFNFRFALQ